MQFSLTPPQTSSSRMVIHLVLPRVTTRWRHYKSQIETILLDCRCKKYETGDVLFCLQEETEAEEPEKIQSLALDLQTKRYFRFKSSNHTDFVMGCMDCQTVILMYFWIIFLFMFLHSFGSLVSFMSKVCRCFEESAPESRTIHAAHLHCHCLGLCDLRELCREVWLFFHQHHVEQLLHVAALLPCAIWSLTSLLISTLKTSCKHVNFMADCFLFVFVTEHWQLKIQHEICSESKKCCSFLWIWGWFS